AAVETSSLVSGTQVLAQPTQAPRLAAGPSEARADRGKNGNGAQARGNGNGRPSAPAQLPATAEFVPVTLPPDNEEPSAEVLLVSELQGRVSALVNAYRVRGHIYADLDPLSRNPPVPTELSLAAFGLER